MVRAVKQIELSPYNYRSRVEVIDYCRANNILIQAYSPLTKGRKLGDPVLEEIGTRHGKTPAQVLIRWGIDKGFAVLAKSVNPDRIAENYDVFDFTLGSDEIERLDDLDEALTTGWDPTDAP